MLAADAPNHSLPSTPLVGIPEVVKPAYLAQKSRVGEERITRASLTQLEEKKLRRRRPATV